MSNKPPNKPHDPAEPSRNTGHPLLRQSQQAMDIADRIANRAKIEEFKIEELDKWRVCINGLVATPNGKAFMKAMISFSGLFTPGDIRDTVKMVEDKSKIAFYLKWVRPYLDDDLRKEVE